ncbi:hypothetical protein [Gryllotalpicola protaetiae]|uniref:hypothetical protein n=1 Tax=Gryllotalpicola protaetiae TaxID=2419771 RepID=UPI0013C499F5|nr:hypothetical protein [Gryllotalpicola protaetiae]
MLLLPGALSLPEGGNPYLYISGLSQAADVLVRSAGSEEVVGPIREKHPDAKVTIARDASTVTPVVVIDVESPSDAATATILKQLVTDTGKSLAQLQEREGITDKNRITLEPLTVDDKSTIKLKQPMLFAAGAGVGGLVVTLIAAAVGDSLLAARKVRKRVRVEAGARVSAGSAASEAHA